MANLSPFGKVLVVVVWLLKIADEARVVEEFSSKPVNPYSSIAILRESLFYVTVG